MVLRFRGEDPDQSFGVEGFQNCFWLVCSTSSTPQVKTSAPAPSSSSVCPPIFPMASSSDSEKEWRAPDNPHAPPPRKRPNDSPEFKQNPWQGTAVHNARTEPSFYSREHKSGLEPNSLQLLGPLGVKRRLTGSLGSKTNSKKRPYGLRKQFFTF